jgi:high-affinity iron transporter
MICHLFGRRARSRRGRVARRLVALLDYLGSDYKNAVQDGKIASEDEFHEMQEFAKRSVDLLVQLKKAEQGDKAGIEKDLKTLALQVENKADEKAVAALAQRAKEKLITAYKIVPYPRRLPALADGKKLYLENCAQCHGASGKGDGPGRESMNPKTPLPANFTDPERIGGLSPFKAFNTASFGIEGTAMASFAALSEEQRWQVAFYVFSLRFPEDSAKAGAALIQSRKVPNELRTVAMLATHSDEQLLEQLKPLAGGDRSAKPACLPAARSTGNETSDPAIVGVYYAKISTAEATEKAYRWPSKPI